MNPLALGPISDMASLHAILFASNPQFGTASHVVSLADIQGDRGGVRQDPPSGAHGVRRQQTPEQPPPPPPAADSDPETTSDDE